MFFLSYELWQADYGSENILSVTTFLKSVVLKNRNEKRKKA